MYLYVYRESCSPKALISRRVPPACGCRCEEDVTERRFARESVSVPRRLSFCARVASQWMEKRGNPRAIEAVGATERIKKGLARSAAAGRGPWTPVVKDSKAFTAPCFTEQRCETVTQLSKNHYADVGRALTVRVYSAGERARLSSTYTFRSVRVYTYTLTSVSVPGRTRVSRRTRDL